MNAIEFKEVNLNVDIPLELYKELEMESQRLGLPVSSVINKMICDRYMHMSIKEQIPDLDVEEDNSDQIYQTKISDWGIFVVLLSGVILIGSLTFFGLSL
jgi:hypothetical protein